MPATSHSAWFVALPDTGEARAASLVFRFRGAAGVALRDAALAAFLDESGQLP
ncbi:hypothetical protein [Nonomuraea diastatica]|uniref:hypothetical protein n=1 Tax=Nonomuraea diastatica TaxID=1848329 RepID=UPI0014086F86|nr:hypothetical protein [Nonomuraea diastatica]